MTETTNVIAERASSDRRVKWQGRIGTDRGRLELVVLIKFGNETVAIPVLSDSELKALLTPAPTQPSTHWICDECNAPNDRGRRWCSVCSASWVA